MGNKSSSVVVGFGQILCINAFVETCTTPIQRINRCKTQKKKNTQRTSMQMWIYLTGRFDKICFYHTNDSHMHGE